jgi:DNA-binding NtrC family response regulator
MPETCHPIQRLARKCTHLRHAQAVDLFLTLYLADAVQSENGNHSRAAQRAGISRERLLRHIRSAKGNSNQIGEDE